VSLADEENDVAGLGGTCGMLDCAPPVELDSYAYSLGGTQAAEHRLDDRMGIFRAGIIRGEDPGVSCCVNRGAHRRSLAAVAVAAAAADDDQPATGT
jgi:hypothetical protein